MWILLAFASALFAGITSILAKVGIKSTDSTVATAIRTIVVLVFAWIMVFIGGTHNAISEISAKSWLFLVLSGLATGASWLCYFRALQLGDINKVVPVDKSSTMLTILLAFIVLGEKGDLIKGIAVVAMTVGTYLMIQKKKDPEQKGKKAWFFYAALSAVFASLVAILGKIGIEGVPSNLGTAIRTGVVLIMAWLMVFVSKKGDSVKTVPKKDLLFICLSGLATGASWLCYFRALQLGPASVVVPIDKLSLLFTIGFAYVVFKEKLTVKALVGLALIVGGTLAMI